MNESNVLDGGNRWTKRSGKIRPSMLPATSEADVRELRLRYNSAYAAYQSCVMALNEAVMSGQSPSSELLRSETTALRELTEARGRLIAAITRLVDDPPF